MPAAAVIPAPIAYIKVVAVKKLVVGFLTREARSVLSSTSILLSSHPSWRATGSFIESGWDPDQLL